MLHARIKNIDKRARNRWVWTSINYLIKCWQTLKIAERWLTGFNFNFWVIEGIQEENNTNCFFMPWYAECKSAKSNFLLEFSILHRILVERVRVHRIHQSCLRANDSITFWAQRDASMLVHFTQNNKYRFCMSMVLQ